MAASIVDHPLLKRKPFGAGRILPIPLNFCYIIDNHRGRLELDEVSRAPSFGSSAQCRVRPDAIDGHSITSSVRTS